MRMPLFSRDTDEDLAAVARHRVARLAVERQPEDRQRSGPARLGGWVPQVPDGARGALSADLDGARGALSADLDGARGALSADLDGAREALSADLGDDEPGHLPGPPVAADPVVEPPRAQPGGRHVRSRAAGALVDRLPLALRALWESRTPGRLRTELGRGQIVVVALVLVAGLAVAAVVYSAGRPEPTPVGAEIVGTRASVAEQPAGHDAVREAEHDPPAAERDTASDAAGSTHPSPEHSDAGVAGDGMLVIHVAGEVGRPGVVTIPAGSRVVDAIDAAGGAADGTDLTPLNLARVLTDGEQVLVGVEPPPGHESPADAGGHAGAGTAPGEGSVSPGDLIDLNMATNQQLETLPGIGPALAQRIVDWREQNGRFTHIDELHEVAGIGPSRFADIAPLVTV